MGETLHVALIFIETLWKTGKAKEPLMKKTKKDLIIEIKTSFTRVTWPKTTQVLGRKEWFTIYYISSNTI